VATYLITPVYPQIASVTGTSTFIVKPLECLNINCALFRTHRPRGTAILQSSAIVARIDFFGGDLFRTKVAVWPAQPHLHNPEEPGERDKSALIGMDLYSWIAGATYNGERANKA
jgi:hypothetical protein